MKDIVMSPEAVSSRAFRDALGRFATGITIVTTSGVEGPMGFTANSFASVSLDPPLVLWSPARSASRFCHFRDAQFFSIHILGIDQFHLIERFSRQGEGFNGLDHDVSAEGVPQFRDALARFDCAQHATHDGGDHLIIVGRVTAVDVTAGAPLVVHGGHFSALA